MKKRGGRFQTCICAKFIIFYSFSIKDDYQIICFDISIYYTKIIPCNLHQHVFLCSALILLQNLLMNGNYNHCLG